MKDYIQNNNNTENAQESIEEGMKQRYSKLSTSPR